MQITPEQAKYVTGSFELVKVPQVGGIPAQRLPEVIDTVSVMLSDIEQHGMDAVRRYARDLDGWDGDFALSAADLAKSGDSLSPMLREALQASAERTQKFAKAARAKMQDLEVEIIPGLVAGHRYIPVERVGGYLPAGRFPILASAFMTVGVAKAAGVPSVIACSPPSQGKPGDPAVLYSAFLSGADRVFILGGVQALAAMVFGLLDEPPVDILVGAGNAYVTEAKRQLFGRVGIDLLAGPSEVAVIADDTADPEIVAADLLGQAEHGPQSPASLVTTSRTLADKVIHFVDQQLESLETNWVAGPAWRDYGTVYVVDSPQTAVEVMDLLAPEHLEIITADDDWYYQRLKNYGSIFLGPWSTVAYSDKGSSGTNHVLPTGTGARYSAGLSVARFLKPLTYQRSDKTATEAIARYVDVITEYEGMAAHRATATMRLDRL